MTGRPFDWIRSAETGVYSRQVTLSHRHTNRKGGLCGLVIGTLAASYRTYTDNPAWFHCRVQMLVHTSTICSCALATRLQSRVCYAPDRRSCLPLSDLPICTCHADTGKCDRQQCSEQCS